MPAWVARVGTPDGAITTRTYEATDERTVRSEVARHGGRVFSVQPAGESGGLLRPAAVLAKGGFSRRRRPVKLEEFLVFNQELVALLKAGLPIVSGLEILLERQQNPAFRRILQDVREQLVSGVALSDAFLSHGETFPRLYATSLKAGERSGEVERVLRRYLSYQKMIGAVRRKVVSALVYPSVLTALSMGLIVILMTYVIPRFTEFYAGFGGDTPLLTKVVVGTATFLKENLVAVAAGAALLAVLFVRWKATPAGRRSLDGLLLKIPLIGTTLHQFALSQFARALATLVGAGTPLVSALEISAGSVSNLKVADAVEQVVPKVREGEELWRSLEGTGQFTSLAVEMVKVGEATGALEEMLTNVAEFYDETIEAMLQRIINMIEPVILVVMGGVIATILLSVYLPMFTIIQNIH